LKIIITIPDDTPEWKLHRLMTAIVSVIGLAEVEVQRADSV